MSYFLLIAILIMCSWILVAINEIDKTNGELCVRLAEKINNMQMQQDGINYQVDGLYQHLVIIKDREDIEAYKKELEERYKDNGDS